MCVCVGGDGGPPPSQRHTPHLVTKYQDAKMGLAACRPMGDVMGLFPPLFSVIGAMGLIRDRVDAVSIATDLMTYLVNANRSK